MRHRAESLATLNLDPLNSTHGLELSFWSILNVKTTAQLILTKPQFYNYIPTPTMGLKESPALLERAPGLMSDSQAKPAEVDMGWPQLSSSGPEHPTDITSTNNQLEGVIDRQKFGSFSSDWMLWNRNELERQGTKKLLMSVTLSN